MVLISDLSRYLIFAGGAFLSFWVIGKPLLKRYFIQNTFPKRKKLLEEFGYSMSTVIIFSIVGFCVHIAKTAGLTKIYSATTDYPEWWLYVSFPVAILIHDLYFYWTHRLMHHKNVYKYVHKVHHKFTNPSPWAAYAFHPIEAVFEAGIFPILVFTLPLHMSIIITFLIYMITRNVLGHLGFELFPKGFASNKWWNWHTTSTHHNMHHKYFNCNYGLYFAWWDDWFGTTHKNYEKEFDEAASGNKSVKASKTITTRAASLFIGLTLLSISLNGQSFVGKWTTFDESTGDPLAVIRIDSSFNGIEGSISKIMINQNQTLDPICIKCDGNKKNKKVIGMEMLWGFTKSNHEWQGGKILDPNNGEMYKSKIWLENSDVLKVRGYGGPFNLFWRTQDWLRAEASTDSTSVVGLWKSIDDRTNHPRAMIKITSNKTGISGRIEELFWLPDEGPDPICLACEGDLKRAKIVGMKILWGFHHHEGKLLNGKIMDPANGKTYNSSMWLLENDKLKVRGYWGPFFRTQVWIRQG